MKSNTWARWLLLAMITAAAIASVQCGRVSQSPATTRAATYRYVEARDLYSRELEHSHGMPVDADIPPDLRALDGINVVMKGNVFPADGPAPDQTWLWLAPVPFPRHAYPPGFVRVQLADELPDRFPAFARVYGRLHVGIQRLGSSFYVYEITADRVEFISREDARTRDDASLPATNAAKPISLAVPTIRWPSLGLLTFMEAKGANGNHSNMVFTGGF